MFCNCTSVDAYLSSTLHYLLFSVSYAIAIKGYCNAVLDTDLLAARAQEAFNTAWNKDSAPLRRAYVNNYLGRG